MDVCDTATEFQIFQSMPDPRDDDMEPAAVLSFAHCLDYTIIHCYILLLPVIITLTCIHLS